MMDKTRHNFLKAFPAIGAMVAAGGAKASPDPELPPLPCNLDRVPYYAVPYYA